MRRLVLVGGGHAHALVLHGWAASPLPDVELTVVSPSALAPYSGMVPGWLAGQYRYEALCLDIQALAAAAGARFVEDEAVGLEPDRRRLLLRSGRALGYEQLSLNIGSTLEPPQVDGLLLPLRPLSLLRTRWRTLFDDLAQRDAHQPLRIAAVGGGAAGVESLLALLARLRERQPARPLHATLVARDADLLPGLSRGAARAVAGALQRAGVELQLGTDWQPQQAAGRDLLLWATGAQPWRWPQASGLASSARGFVQVDATLRSTSHPNVHAGGDCVDGPGPLPKAGVFAVRMGPLLLNNLRAALGHGQAQPFRPQQRTLALLNTADGRAVAAWGPLWAEGRWALRWKDRIDRGFIARFPRGSAYDAERARPT